MAWDRLAWVGSMRGSSPSVSRGERIRSRSRADLHVRYHRSSEGRDAEPSESCYFWRLDQRKSERLTADDRFYGFCRSLMRSACPWSCWVRC